MNRLDLLLISLVFVFSLCLFLFKIDQITPGIWNDELTVAQVSQDLVSQPQLHIYDSGNYGHPTPLLYLTGWSLSLFGNSLFSLRLVSVIFGSLSGVALYVLVRRISYTNGLHWLLHVCWSPVIQCLWFLGLLMKYLLAYFLKLYRYTFYG